MYSNITLMESSVTGQNTQASTMPPTQSNAWQVLSITVDFIRNKDFVHGCCWRGHVITRHNPAINRRRAYCNLRTGAWILFVCSLLLILIKWYDFSHRNMGFIYNGGKMQDLKKTYCKFRGGMYFLFRMVWNKEMLYHHYFSTSLYNTKTCSFRYRLPYSRRKSSQY
jgi:hypothetical protein